MVNFPKHGLLGQLRTGLRTTGLQHSFNKNLCLVLNLNCFKPLAFPTTFRTALLTYLPTYSPRDSQRRKIVAWQAGGSIGIGPFMFFFPLPDFPELLLPQNFYFTSYYSVISAEGRYCNAFCKIFLREVTIECLALVILLCKKIHITFVVVRSCSVAGRDPCQTAAPLEMIYLQNKSIV